MNQTYKNNKRKKEQNLAQQETKQADQSKDLNKESKKKDWKNPNRGGRSSEE